MRNLFFALIYFLSQAANAQFSNAGYTTSLVSGTTSGGDWESIVSSDGVVSGSEAAGGTYINYAGFVPTHLTAFTFDKEVLALEALYDQAGGDDWISKDNWNTTAFIDTWSNVTVVNRRVTDLNLASNNLVGTIPDEIAALPLLGNLDVSDNGLIAIPDLSGVATLDLRNNKLNFENLIPNLHGQYDPQKAVGEPTYDSAYVDENFQLSAVNFTHAQTEFQWGKEGDINGATQADYLIAPLTYESQGAYQLTATNPNVPGLILTGEARNVTALGDLAVSVTDVSGSGEVALMKFTEGVGALDTVYLETFSNGSIELLRVALSDYLVGVRPDDTNLIPSYYINSFLWDEADELEMRERNRSITIGTTPTPPPLTPQDGNGQIIGYVEQEYDDGNGRIEARRRAKKTRCHVRRNTGGGRDEQDNYVLIASLDTDDNGEFVIDYLPAGMYRLNIEYPGIPMDENSFVQFTIDENRSSYNLEAVINDSDIEVTDVTVLSIGEQLTGLKIFPNPSSDFVQIDLSESNVSQDVMLEVFDSVGRSILSKAYGNQKSLIEIDIRRFRMGSYYLKMNVGDQVYSYRILVNR